MSLIENFVSRVREVVGDSPAGLHEPVLNGNEASYLTQCIESGYVSSVGSFVNAFEGSLEKFTGAKHAIAVVNGTAGLQLALRVVGVLPGDEVIVPALSFVATANAVSHAGAEPHFVDVDPDTWGLDPAALRSHLHSIGVRSKNRIENKMTGRRIAAIVVMHTLGHPADIEGIAQVAKDFGLILIEDSAESLGSFVGNRHTGLFGSIGVFSFNGNKTITTGGGGALTTDDEELAARIRHVSTTARIAHPWEFEHDEVGFNFRMPNINAALGVAQVEQLPNLVGRQRELFLRYRAAFDGFEIGEIKSERPGTTSNYWLQSFLLFPDQQHSRDGILSACIAKGIGARPLWKPLNSLAPYAHAFSAKTPVTLDLYKRVVCIPSSASLVSAK